MAESKRVIRVEDKTYKSCNGINSIHTRIWYPDESEYVEPMGVIQIAHGMIDHIGRYSNMAVFMAERGFVVVGNDHLGHGESVESEEDYGFFTHSNDPGKYIVKDMHRLTVIMKKKYPYLPYFMIGHSMGSFMVRRYLISYADELTGAILMGTGNQPKLVVAAGLALAKFTGLIHGERYRSALLHNIMFGRSSKKIDNPRTSHDWLTRDESIVDDYESDDKCSYMFTINGYYGLLKTIQIVSSNRGIAEVPYDLPILMLSGEDDPVGGYGVEVDKLYDKYLDYFDDVEFNLYKDCRHELHNEFDQEEVFTDIYDWMIKHY